MLKVAAATTRYEAALHSSLAGLPVVVTKTESADLVVFTLH